MRTLAYLASPYSKHRDGLAAAHAEACKLAARLIESGIHVFSPVAHSHPIALYGRIDPLDQKFWLDHCLVMLGKCDTLIVAHLEGWQESTGVAFEIESFLTWKRDIFDLDPVTLRMEKRKREAA